MKTYKPRTGENITETAKRMVALAKKKKMGPVTTNFNNITLTVNPCDNPDTIVQYYRTESSR